MIFDPKWKVGDKREETLLPLGGFVAIMVVIAVAAALMIVYAPKFHAAGARPPAIQMPLASPIG